MSLDTNIFKNFLINEMFEHDENGKKISRADAEIKFNFLSNALKESNAVIAGGGVLGAYYEESNLSDIDVYVNRKNAIKFKNRMIELGYNNFCDLILQPQYDRSFFVKNNIIARFPITKKNISCSNKDVPYIDIIIVSDNVDVMQVVNNFDLTFCEIWYDGTHVNAADPKGILEKKGYLKPDYVIGLLKSLNNFTRKRMNKYAARGFQIKYDNTAVKTDIIFEGSNSICFEGNASATFKCKVSDPEKWVVSIILRSIIRDMLNPNYIQYIDINSIKNRYRNQDFNELLRIIKHSKDYLKEPRFREAYNFFQNVSFDVFCMCDFNDYSLNSLTNILNCLGVPVDKRREYIIALLSVYGSFDNEYLNYINKIVGISYRDMLDFAERKRKESTIIVQSRKRKFEEDDDEEEESRKRKFEDDEEEEEETDDVYIPNSPVYGPYDDDSRKSITRKRKFDEEEFEENNDFMTADVANITARLANIRAREDDNITTKKRRLGNDSGEYDDIVFVNKNNNLNASFKRSYLKMILRNKHNLFFECTSSNKIVSPIVIYVKIPLNDRKGFYCFIPINNIQKLLMNNSEVYHLYPVLQNGRQKSINNSGSLNNLNICRSHENIPVYRIKSSPQVYFEGAEISERF